MRLRNLYNTKGRRAEGGNFNFSKCIGFEAGIQSVLNAVVVKHNVTVMCVCACPMRR